MTRYNWIAFVFLCSLRRQLRLHHQALMHFRRSSCTAVEKRCSFGPVDAP